MINIRKDHSVKKSTLPNVIMAVIVTIIMLGLTVSNAFFGAVRIVAYGELDNLIFLLPVPIAVTVIYTVWLLARRFPGEVRGFAMSFGLLLGLLIFYLTSHPACSETQFCLDLWPLLAFGIFLLIVFLLSLYYLARVRRIERQIKKRTTK